MISFKHPMQAWDESIAFKVMHGKLILHLSSDSKVPQKGTKLCKYLPLSFFAFLQEIQNVSYHETVTYHSNSLKETIWRLSKRVLWFHKSTAKTSDLFLFSLKWAHTPPPPTIPLWKRLQVQTEKIESYLFLQIGVTYFCFSKNFFMLQVQIKVSIVIWALKASYTVTIS